MSARSPRDFAQVLLRRAGEDATAVSEFGANSRIADSVIGFHAQQAAEKSLKAVMIVHGLNAPRTHDLDLLCERLDAAGVPLPVERDRLAELTALAGQARYEDLFDTEPLDRAAILELVDQVMGWARKTVASEAPG